MNKLTALIEAAKSATPGPWETIENPCPAFGGVQLYWIDSEAGNLAENICEEEAIFIALANPATILELCALLEKAEETLERISSINYAWVGVEALAAIKQWKEKV